MDHGTLVKENRPTISFVFLMLIGLGAVFVADIGIPLERLAFYAILLLVEMWSILNDRKGDTISEAFWELSSRPLVPWVCGVLTTYFVMHGTITHIAEVGALLALQGHFFWQSDSVYERLRQAEASTEAAEANAEVAVKVANVAVATATVATAAAAAAAQPETPESTT